LTQMFESDGD